MPPRPNKHHQPSITRVIVEGAQFVPHVPVTRSKPKEHLALVVVNKDNTDYTLRLTNFKNKAAGTPVNESDLFVVVSASHALPKDDISIIRRRTKPAGNWGTTFPYTTYEFTLELWDASNTTKLDDLDPDFDITP